MGIFTLPDPPLNGAAKQRLHDQIVASKKRERRFEFVPLAGSSAEKYGGIDRLVIPPDFSVLGTARGAKSERPTPQKCVWLPTQRKRFQASRPCRRLRRRADAHRSEPNARIRGASGCGREPAHAGVQGRFALISGTSTERVPAKP